ncbi:actin [Acrasis kona]|uniref:Actin n=1 Tax=Acrasis kona TaxID=1008807 RepID=A0AAW2ZG70_9EUKA
MDNHVIKNDDERSIFTVIIYLNDDYTGGGTAFYDRSTDCQLPFINQSQQGSSVVVTPKAGNVLIFNHDVLHEGLEVTQGIKYIMRCEIMFKRVTNSGSILNNKSLQSLLQSVKLYEQSNVLESDGSLNESTIIYLKALGLQVNYSPSVDVFENHIESLSNEILMIIFDYLGHEALEACSRVCKRWNYFALESSLWEKLYNMHHYPPPVSVNINKYNKLLSVEKHQEHRRIHEYEVEVDLIGAETYEYDDSRGAKFRLRMRFRHDLLRRLCILMGRYGIECTHDRRFYGLIACECEVFEYDRHLICNKVDMAILGSKIKTGLFVYVGGYSVTVVAVVNGAQIKSSRIRSEIGPSFFCDLIECSRFYHYPIILKKLFYVSLDYDKESKEFESLPPHELELEGNVAVIPALDCIKGPESLFKQVSGTTENNLQRVVIPKMIRNCLKKVKKNILKKVVGNVVVAGGGSQLSGFPERLQKEIAILMPTIDVVVVADPEREQFVWRGASKYAADLARKQKNK